jgi:hypothetical protein
MNNKIITVAFVLGVLLLAGGILILKNNPTSTDVSEKVARWIGEHSVVYVQAGCIHCKEQEDLFGDNVKYLTMVDCIPDRAICIEKGISGTPTWIINNVKYPGVQSVEKLKELTGYQD